MDDRLLGAQLERGWAIFAKFVQMARECFGKRLSPLGRGFESFWIDKAALVHGWRIDKQSLSPAFDIALARFRKF